MKYRSENEIRASASACLVLLSLCISASANPSEWRSGQRRLISGLSSKQDKHYTITSLMVPFYKRGKPFFKNVCQIIRSFLKRGKKKKSPSHLSELPSLLSFLDLWMFQKSPDFCHKSFYCSGGSHHSIVSKYINLILVVAIMLWDCCVLPKQKTTISGLLTYLTSV